jgi:cytochrome b6-f complex iron-sulfur subunit
METMETTESILHTEDERERFPRRGLFQRLGWGGLSVLLVLSVPGLLRFLKPPRDRTTTGVIDVGSIRDFRAPIVATRWLQRHGLWIVHRDGRLFVLEARCTHLGCTPRWAPEHGVFQCPCHGSRFTPEGVVLNGPAARPLDRFAISVERDQVLVDKSRRASLEEAERDPRFWVRV